NKYLLYLVAQYPAGTNSSGTAYPSGIFSTDFVYKDKWNGLITSHEVQVVQSLNPTNLYVATGTNWTGATWLCGVANLKRYPGAANGNWYVPDAAVITFSTPLNLGISDIVIGPPPSPGTAVICAGNGYDGTPSMNPTNYAPPGTMEQWNADVTSAVPGNVSAT